MFTFRKGLKCQPKMIWLQIVIRLLKKAIIQLTKQVSSVYCLSLFNQPFTKPVTTGP